MANFIPTNVDDGNNQIVKLIAGASFDTKTLYFDRALFSFEVNDALPITIKAFDPTTNTQERITIPAGGLSADMKSATGVKRGIAPNGTDITTESATFGANLSKGTHIFPIVSPQVLNQIVGAMDGTTNISPKFGSAPTWDTTQSNVAASMPVYANAATGQAAITSPVNGYKFYATAEGVIYKYEAGSWTTEGSSTTANASETVAGKSQIATTAQVDDGDTVGSTGAPIVLTPDKLNPKNLTNTKATIADGDSTMISNSEAGGALVKVLYSTIKTFFQSGLTFLGLADTPASYSGLGGRLLRVNAAENAVESFAQNTFGVLGGGSIGDGTNNLSEMPFIIGAGANIVSEANTERSTTNTSATKTKEIVIPETGTYSISFDIKISSASGQVYAQIYKNGVAFGTFRNWNGTAYQSFSENLSFAKGDLAQLYIYSDSSLRTAFCRNFSVKCAVTFTPPTPVGTVNTD